MFIDAILPFVRREVVQVKKTEMSTSEKLKKINKIVLDLLIGELALIASMFMVANSEFCLSTISIYPISLIAHASCIFTTFKIALTYLIKAFSHVKDLYDNWKEHKIVKA